MIVDEICDEERVRYFPGILNVAILGGHVLYT